MTYTHLTKEERYYLCQNLKSKKSLRQIAKELERNASTLSRELKRNVGQRGYRYKQADYKSQERQANKGKKRISTNTWLVVEDMICRDFSPEQISGSLGLQGIRISHEWISFWTRKTEAACIGIYVANVSVKDDTGVQIDVVR